VKLVMRAPPQCPGERITANGTQLVSYHPESRIAAQGIFYPINPATYAGETY